MVGRLNIVFFFCYIAFLQVLYTCFFCEDQVLANMEKKKSQVGIEAIYGEFLCVCATWKGGIWRYNMIYIYI